MDRSATRLVSYLSGIAAVRSNSIGACVTRLLRAKLARVGSTICVALAVLHTAPLMAQPLPNHLLSERPAPMQSMPVQPAPVQRAPAQSRPPMNLLMQAGQTLGFHRCASALDQISARVLAGTRKHDIVLDWDRAHPDSGPFFSLTGMQFPAVSALLSLSVIPSLKLTNQGLIDVETFSLVPLQR